jgi:hypothetical protein
VGQLAACAAPWGAAEWAAEVAVTYPLAEDPEDEYADGSGRLYTTIRFYSVV